MANLWLKILKPSSASAKWLIVLALIVMAVFAVSGHFEIFKEYLDTEKLTLKVGSYEISAYQILSGLISVAVILWIAAIVSNFVDTRISKMRSLRVADKTLLKKMTQIGIYALAFISAMEVLGIDLTTLTVLGGALGIGIGFGLQKISSNFISGLILLLEKAIKQGDLIELADGTYGFVQKLKARYTLIETVDGKEVLVPNEDFIVNQVVNWTFSNSKCRIQIDLGVSYNADIDLAKNLILEAASENAKCMSDPGPQCYLLNFGDSSVDFRLFFWISNILDGRWETQSEVMFSIWHKFKENNIEIPFPQRDLHIKSGVLSEAPQEAANAPSDKKTAAKQSS